MRAATHGSMPLHVIHFAVVAGIEPPQQVLLVFGNLHTGDAELAEAERPGTCNERLLDRLEVKNFKLSHGQGTGVSIISAWHYRSPCIPLRKYALSMHTPSKYK